MRFYILEDLACFVHNRLEILKPGGKVYQINTVRKKIICRYSCKLLWPVGNKRKTRAHEKMFISEVRAIELRGTEPAPFLDFIPRPFFAGNPNKDIFKSAVKVKTEYDRDI